MTREQFIEAIESGGDIMFDCGDKHFTICYWSDSPIDVAEQITEENHRVFDKPDDLLKEYMVNGLPLGKQLDTVVITFQS